jgi:hypothetical protein
MTMVSLACRISGKEAVQVMQQETCRRSTCLWNLLNRIDAVAACQQDLLAEKRRNRCVWPDCRTVMQGTQMDGYFAQYLTEDRCHPKQPSYQDYLQSVLKGMSLR